MRGSTLTPEFLSDRLRVHYRLQKPYGMLDEEGTKDVRYDTIAQLPFPPTVVGSGGINWSQEFEIPSIGETVVFMFDSFAENSMGPNEHVLYGPYRKPQAKAPS